MMRATSYNLVLLGFTAVFLQVLQLQLSECCDYAIRPVAGLKLQLFKVSPHMHNVNVMDHDHIFFDLNHDHRSNADAEPPVVLGTPVSDEVTTTSSSSHSTGLQIGSAVAGAGGEVVPGLQAEAEAEAEGESGLDSRSIRALAVADRRRRKSIFGPSSSRSGNSDRENNQLKNLLWLIYYISVVAIIYHLFSISLTVEVDPSIDIEVYDTLFDHVDQ